MYKFSDKSKKRLESCDKRLQEIFNEVIKHYDCTIIQGYRTTLEQEELYKAGKSKVQRSKHNKYPAEAVDVAPYPIVWDDYDRFKFFGGFVCAVAAMKGVKIRWGGDWDSDRELDDQTINDYVHFELIGD